MENFEHIVVIPRKVAIVKHNLHLDRSTCEVLRGLNASMLDKTPLRDIFSKKTNMGENDIKLNLNFFSGL